MDCGLIAVPFGPLQSNQYIITGKTGIFIIDPSVSPEKTDAFCSTVPDLSGIGQGKAHIKAFLLTHGHHDHIKYVEEWQKLYPQAKLFFSNKDEELLYNPFMNCSYMEGLESVYHFEYTDIAGKDGEIIYSDQETEIKVFETPGHTMGSVCFLVKMNGKEKLFCGDTVFNGSVGRTDMPGGSSKLIMESVRKIKTFDPDLPIYPGHGPDSTIGEEIRYNPFFEM